MKLEVRDLYTSYGLSQILFGVSLEVAEGKACASSAAMAWERRPPCAASWGSPRRAGGA